MVVAELLRAARRCWYVVLAGMMVTALGCLYIVTHEGVYYSRVNVILLAPSSATFPNSLTTTSADLIQTAGIVEAIVNGTAQQRKLAEAGATMVGRGFLDGSAVTLPDNGGQWAPHFNRQFLDVQVVGPSESVVRARQAELVTQIETALEEIQEAAGVAPVNRISTELDVETPTVRYMNGQPRRALAMTSILGGGMTLAAVLLVESRRRRRLRGTKDGRAPVSVPMTA
ncbi:hypothetical protein [Georgenia yuyongxinii]|uniref:Polysaccharide chain length determinant N-terminal domain-containing protein n=1 Tax=Georgenia yuyongxinii TaxID=2589797 RepID=A0A552WLP7_9MICO|nr:hypothetical protein [Georgenia yuyongxinii]TRW43569.1 hypothetical protein FJ693_17090 [Georgenia yuyongxinii]